MTRVPALVKSLPLAGEISPSTANTAAAIAATSTLETVPVLSRRSGWWGEWGSRVIRASAERWVISRCACSRSLWLGTAPRLPEAVQQAEDPGHPEGERDQADDDHGVGDVGGPAPERRRPVARAPDAGPGHDRGRGDQSQQDRGHRGQGGLSRDGPG